MTSLEEVFLSARRSIKARDLITAEKKLYVDSSNSLHNLIFLFLLPIYIVLWVIINSLLRFQNFLLIPILKISMYT